MKVTEESNMIYSSSEILSDRVMKYSGDLICIIDTKADFLEVSDACRLILGYNPEELVGKSLINLIHPSERETTCEFLVKVMEEESILRSFENTLIHKDGTLVPVQWTYQWSATDQLLFCIGHDNSEIFQTLQKLHQKEEFYQRLVEFGSDMIRLMDIDGYYTYSGPSTTRILGYPPEALIGKKAFSFIHPDDLNEVKKSFKALKQKKYVQISDLRFKNIHGEWRWLETIISNQMDNPSVRAMVVSSRDITDRKNATLRLQQSEQLFKSLFENNPDVVFLTNKDGIIIDSNPAIQKVFSLQRESVINTYYLDLVPDEIKGISKEYFEKAIKGITSIYEGRFHTSEGLLIVLDISKVPVIVNNEVIGVFSIIKDRTAITHSYNTIQRQAEKLHTILESITDAVFTVDKNWCFTYVNSECERLFQTVNVQLTGKNIWETFPEEINGVFYSHYQEAVATGKPVRFKGFFRRLNIWADVRAFPSEEGLSVFFVDISEKVAKEEELKKLSIVASKTNNGVIIADQEKRIEWVNESFSRITDYQFEEIHGIHVLNFFANQSSIKELFSDIFDKPLENKSHISELKFKTKSCKESWLRLEIIPIFDNEQISRYIIMLTDITAEKQATIERIAFIEELKQNNESLLEFNQIVSHNLRGPVANILGLSTIIDSPGIDDETYNTAIKSIGVAANNLDGVIHDLNNILGKRNNHIREKENVVLEDVLSEVLNNIKETDSEKIKLDIDFSKASSVFTVRSYLKDILYNLLINSIKFRCPAKKAHIRVSSKMENGYTLLQVKDNGIGIDLDKHKNNLFKLYHRLNTNIEGKGIGLFLVKTLLDAAGGKIEVNSKEGNGSTFNVYLK